MLIGSDTTTETAPGMTNIVAPIINEGTHPSMKQIFTTDGSSTGVWEVMYRGMWNRGTVSGTIGEVGLYLRMPTITTIGWSWGYYGSVSGTYTPTRTLVSRLSVADSDFPAHTIIETEPLTIDWTIRLQF